MTLGRARARFFRYFQSTVPWGSHFRVTASVIIPPSLFAWPHQLEWRNTSQNLMYLDTCDLKLHLREGIVSILHFNKNIRCQLPSCVFKSFSKKASRNSKVRACKKVSAVCNAALLGMIKKKGHWVSSYVKNENQTDGTENAGEKECESERERNVAIGFKTGLCVKRFVLRRNFLQDFLHPVPVLTQPCLHLQRASARHMAPFRLRRELKRKKSCWRWLHHLFSGLVWRPKVDSNSSQDLWSQNEREDDGEQWWLTLHKAVGVGSERGSWNYILQMQNANTKKSGCTKIIKLDVLWHAVKTTRLTILVFLWNASVFIIKNFIIHAHS